MTATSGKIDAAVFDFTRAFPLFAPASAGDYPKVALLTIRGINRALPALSELARSVGHRAVEPIDIADFVRTPADTAAAEELKVLFDRHGSDKSTTHDYHMLYGSILSARERIRGILEIGMGTNNPTVVSNMGVLGKPGASLRAFRDFLPSARIYGADIDTGILFQEERIETFFVDQTDSTTLADLEKALPAELDLIIDDGLHAPHANINTLRFALGRVGIGGWVVIEDISHAALPVWEVVAALMPERFQSQLCAARGGYLFVVKRLG